MVRWTELHKGFTDGFFSLLILIISVAFVNLSRNVKYIIFIK